MKKTLSVVTILMLLLLLVVPTIAAPMALMESRNLVSGISIDIGNTPLGYRPDLPNITEEYFDLDAPLTPIGDSATAAQTNDGFNSTMLIGVSVCALAGVIGISLVLNKKKAK